MTISGSGTYTINSDTINVISGNVTVDGNAGGFNESITLFNVGAYNQTATLNLVGGGSGVSVSIEDPSTQGFNGRIDVGNGQNENATLNISGGAVVNSVNNAVYDAIAGYAQGAWQSIRIGAGGGTGNVTVDGSGSALWARGAIAPRIDVGRSFSDRTATSYGTLTIQNGADAGSLSMMIGRGGNGTVTVDGAGSTFIINDQFGQYGMEYGVSFDDNAGGVTVGRTNVSRGIEDPGQGTLNITNGGQMNIYNTDGTTDGPFLNIARGSGTTGTVTVSGTGSQINITQNGDTSDNSPFIGIGRGGQATLVIEQGGEVNVLGDDAHVNMGQDFGGEEADGATNTLNINTGGKLNINNNGGDQNAGMIIGRSDGTDNLVNVDGAGSQINITSDIGTTSGPTPDDFGSFLNIGRKGDGTVNVTNGGEINIVSNEEWYPTLMVGRGEDDGSGHGNGILNIDGTGSKVELSGMNSVHEGGQGFISVGRRENSEGTINITNGGLLKNSDGDSSAEIGGNPNTRGTVSIDGAGSEFDAGRSLNVAVDYLNGLNIPWIGGDGRLMLSNDGTVRADTLFFGENAFADLVGNVYGNTDFRGFMDNGDDAAGTLNHFGDFSFGRAARMVVDIFDFAGGVGDKIDITGAAEFLTKQSFIAIDMDRFAGVMAGDSYVIATASGGMTAETVMVYEINSGIEFTLAASGNDLVLTANETLAAPGNALPVVNVEDQTIGLGQWRQLSQVVDLSDADFDEPTMFEVYDNSGADSWWADGGLVSASTGSGYQATSLSGIYFQGEATVGLQTLWVRANDGTAWSTWESFTLETTMGPGKPVVTVPDQQVGTNQWLKLENFWTAMDPDGDTITKIQIYDDTGGNNWWVDGAFVDGSTGNGFETTSVSNTWLRGDALDSTQTLSVRAFDGQLWSDWVNFDLTTGTGGGTPNQKPFVTVGDQTGPQDQWFRFTDVATYGDDDPGDAVETFQVWDGTGNNSWWVNGSFIDASAGNGAVVNETDNIWFRANDANQTLWVRANDGDEYGAWDTFAVTVV